MYEYWNASIGWFVTRERMQIGTSFEYNSVYRPSTNPTAFAYGNQLSLCLHHLCKVYWSTNKTKLTSSYTAKYWWRSHLQSASQMANSTITFVLFCRYSIFAWGLPAIFLGASMVVQYRDKAGKLGDTKSLVSFNCW